MQAADAAHAPNATHNVQGREILVSLPHAYFEKVAMRRGFNTIYVLDGGAWRLAFKCRHPSLAPNADCDIPSTLHRGGAVVEHCGGGAR